MASPDDSLGNKVRDIALSTGPAIAATTLAHNPILAVVAASLGTLAAIVLEASWSRRAEPFWEAFARDLRQTKTVEEIPQQIAERVKADPKYVERIHQVLVRLRDAFSDDVATAMGVLAAEYTTSEPVKPPDAFFRGMLGVLASVDSEEFEALTSLVQAMHEYPTNAHEHYSLGLRHVAPNELGLGRYPFGASSDYTTPRLILPLGRRMCHLLRTNGLADDGDGREFGADVAQMFHSTATVESEVAQRMYAILFESTPDPAPVPSTAPEAVP